MKMALVEPAASGTPVQEEITKVIGIIGSEFVEMFMNQMQSTSNYMNEQLKEELNDG
jgi:hypothetical protein